MVIPRFRALNATTTWGIGLFDLHIVDTIETRNIQALLATNFKDLGTGGEAEQAVWGVIGP